MEQQEAEDLFPRGAALLYTWTALTRSHPGTSSHAGDDQGSAEGNETRGHGVVFSADTEELAGYGFVALSPERPTPLLVKNAACCPTIAPWMPVAPPPIAACLRCAIRATNPDVCGAS